MDHVDDWPETKKGRVRRVHINPNYAWHEMAYFVRVRVKF